MPSVFSGTSVLNPAQRLLAGGPSLSYASRGPRSTRSGAFHPFMR